LLVIVLFVYAVIGMHLFEGKSDKSAWEFGDDRACFKDFATTFGTLVRISSGDGWTDVYERYLGDVDPDDRASVYLYFCSFYFLGALVMINLFIAVILESFDEEKDAMKREQELKTIKVWRAIWQEYDKKSSGTLLATEFIDMLKHVPRPLGFFNIEGLQQKSNSKTDGGLILDGPKHRDVLDLLLKLNLFVEKKPYGENNEKMWCVDYEDALMFYVTMFIGPEVDVEPAPDIHIESMNAADWYALETNTVNLLDTLVQEQAETRRKKKVARYILDIYVDELMVESQNTGEFENIEGFDKISLGINTARKETIELQNVSKRASGSNSHHGRAV